MDYLSAVAKIRYHASLGLCGDEDPSTSLTYAIWNATNYGVGADFVGLFKDVLGCLEAINRHINGAVPSLSTEQPATLDIDLVRSVSAILDCGWQIVAPHFATPKDCEREIQMLGPLFWAISCAWTTILEGDIDSLIDNVRYVAAANEIEIDL